MKFNTTFIFAIMAIGLSITTLGHAETVSGQIIQKNDGIKNIPANFCV